MVLSIFVGLIGFGGCRLGSVTLRKKNINRLPRAARRQVASLVSYGEPEMCSGCCVSIAMLGIELKAPCFIASQDWSSKSL